MTQLHAPIIFNDQPLLAPERAYFQFDIYADTLAAMIMSPNVSTPLTIGINGAWGTGKTTLMQKVKTRLEANQLSEPNTRMCRSVWFNAWKYSRSESLFVALVQEILREMKRTGVLNKVYADWVDPLQPEFQAPEALLSTLSQVLSLGQLNIDLSKFEKESRFRANLPFLDEFQAIFDRLLRFFIGGQRDQSGNVDDRKGAMVIFIDDLDRCLPQQTLQVLETIKLFMDKKGTIFVLGADLGVVLSAIDAHYKSQQVLDLNAQEYIEKLIQVRFDLPPIRTIDMQRFIEELPGIDDALRHNLSIIAKGVPTNPRKVKNFINHEELQWGIIANANLADRMDKRLLIEWLILNSACPDFARTIRNLGTDVDRVQFIESAKILFTPKTPEDSERVSVDFEARQFLVDGRSIEGLTPQEWSILTLFYKERGKAVSLSQITSALGGSEGNLPADQEAKRIRTSISRLKGKLGSQDVEKYFTIENIRDVGYRLIESGGPRNAEKYILTKISQKELESFRSDPILPQILRTGEFDFREETIGLYIHLSQAPSLITTLTEDTVEVKEFIGVVTA